MEEFQTLIMELQHMEDIYRDFQHARKLAGSLEALHGENTRLTEQHRALEAACAALQAAHDAKLAVLEEAFTAAEQNRTAQAAAHQAAQDKKLAALEEEFTAVQEARTAQAAAHEAALHAGVLAWQERAERARDHAIKVETHLTDTCAQHESAMRSMQADYVKMQAELETISQQLVDKNEEVQKRFQHLRSLANREIV